MLWLLRIYLIFLFHYTKMNTDLEKDNKNKNIYEKSLNGPVIFIRHLVNKEVKVKRVNAIVSNIIQ